MTAPKKNDFKHFLEAASENNHPAMQERAKKLDTLAITFDEGMQLLVLLSGVQCSAKTFKLLLELIPVQLVDAPKISEPTSFIKAFGLDRTLSNNEAKMHSESQNNPKKLDSDISNEFGDTSDEYFEFKDCSGSDSSDESEIYADCSSEDEEPIIEYCDPEELAKVTTNHLLKETRPPTFRRDTTGILEGIVIDDYPMKQENESKESDIVHDIYTPPKTSPLSSQNSSQRVSYLSMFTKHLPGILTGIVAEDDSSTKIKTPGSDWNG